MNEGNRSSTQGDAAENSPITVEGILELGYAHRKSKVLLSAVEIGLFTVLADGPLELAVIRQRTGLHERAARDFLDALVAVNLVRRDAAGRYANAPACAQYLDKRKPSYIGGVLEQLNARLYASWCSLGDCLRTGAPVGALGQGGYRQFYGDRTDCEGFLGAMSGGSLLAAAELAARFPWQQFNSFVDIGTARGCVPVALARAHSHLRGGGFDLPEVESAFTRYVQVCGLSDRLQFHAGDFMRDPLPEADVLLMGRILHNWDVPTRRYLIAQAWQALHQPGALIVYDAMIDDARRGPAHSLLASLNMLIETAGGSEYTPSECTAWMRDVGFSEFCVLPLGRLSAVVAMKRG